MGRGTVHQRSPGSFTLAVSAGFDPVTGKRRRIWRTVKTSSVRVARKELTKLQNEVDEGLVSTHPNLELRHWFDRWLDEVVALRSRPRTVQGYRSHVEVWLKPYLGRIKLSELTAVHITHLLAQIREQGRSANTCNKVFTTLRLSLRDAVKQGLIRINAADGIDRPRFSKKPIKPPSIEVVQSIIQAFADHPYEAIIRFMVSTGVRRGEAVALRWDNVDLERGVCSIVEAAVRVAGQGQMVFPPKSQSSKRGIHLDRPTITLLRSHRAAQTEHAMSIANIYDQHGYVFATESGRMVDLDRLSQTFKRIARQTGNKNVNLHALRHFHATMLIAAGTHPKVVQDRLGHSSAAFTMQVYGHSTAQMQQEAAANFARLMS